MMTIPGKLTQILTALAALSLTAASLVLLSGCEDKGEATVPKPTLYAATA